MKKIKDAVDRWKETCMGQVDNAFRDFIYDFLDDWNELDKITSEHVEAYTVARVMGSPVYVNAGHAMVVRLLYTLI